MKIIKEKHYHFIITKSNSCAFFTQLSILNSTMPISWLHTAPLRRN